MLCGLKLPTGFPGSGDAMSGMTCALPRAMRNELEGDLQMTTTCVGLGGTQERQSCQTSVAAACASPGATQQE